MTTLLIEHLENDWQIASPHRAPNGGGWPSVAALQEANVRKTWYAPKRWPEGLTIERAVLHPTGVVLERWRGCAWVPTTRLSLED